MRIVLLLAAFLLVPVAVGQRLQVSINDGWRFSETEAGVGVRVDLPHTWNTRDAFDKPEGYRRGDGWYRRDLPLTAAHAGKRLFLYFEGANQVADVWVNSRHAGQHVGGYTAFVFDVTDLVTVPGANTITVRVNNAHDDDIPPLDADFTFYGGIYRDVWLVATEPVHIDLLDHAGPGVYLTLREVQDSLALVDYEVHVRNTTDRPVRRRVEVQMRMADGKALVMQGDSGNPYAGKTMNGGIAEVEVPPNSVVVARATLAVSNPQRWSPETPALYRATARLTEPGAALSAPPLDHVAQPFGIRTIRVDGNGFYLNGEKITLTGSNRHQDLPGKGNALSNAEHWRDVEIVKETGFNFLRLAHYPQDEAVLRATDALGLAVWEEVPVVNTITMSEAFAQNATTMLVEMIKQHYNHPSVVMWGYMNEILLRIPRPMPEGYIEAVRALAQRHDDVAKREDPSRPTAMAVSRDELDESTGIPAIPDIFGLNLYFGWYYGTFADLGALLDTLHARFPDRPLMVSEYGAGTDERVHAENPVAFDFSVEHGEAFHRESFAQIEARDYLVGSAVWNHFDFGSAGRQDTKNAINQKGLYYFDRTPKDIAFYYKALLRDEPVLRLERDHRYRNGYRLYPPGVRSGRRDPHKVQVYTNADSVVLRMNGEVKDGRVPENGRAVLDVFLWGSALLEVEGFWGDERRVDTVPFHVRQRGYQTDPGVLEALNLGAAYSYTDATGVVYVPIFMSETSTRTHHRIYGTDDDPLFQAFKENPEPLKLRVANGSYDVTLGFMEPTGAQPGDRVFDVTVNGQTVIEALDLAAEAGRWTALARTVRVAVTDGALELDFVPHAGKPILSSLLIVRR